MWHVSLKSVDRARPFLKTFRTCEPREWYLVHYMSILARAGALASDPTRWKLMKVTVSEATVSMAVTRKFLRDFTRLTKIFVTVELVDELTEPTVFTYVMFLANCAGGIRRSTSRPLPTYAGVR